MSKECHLDDIAYINKILSDSLTVVSGYKVDTMEYYSCNIKEFHKEITSGVLIVFKDEKPIQIETCNHIKSSIEKFLSNNSNVLNIGIGIIYNIQNVKSEKRALYLIENYLGLIFDLD